MLYQCSYRSNDRIGATRKIGERLHVCSENACMPLYTRTASVVIHPQLGLGPILLQVNAVLQLTSCRHYQLVIVRPSSTSKSFYVRHLCGLHVHASNSYASFLYLVASCFHTILLQRMIGIRIEAVFLNVEPLTMVCVCTFDIINKCVHGMPL